LGNGVLLLAAALAPALVFSELVDSEGTFVKLVDWASAVGD